MKVNATETIVMVASSGSEMTQCVNRLAKIKDCVPAEIRAYEIFRIIRGGSTEREQRKQAFMLDQIKRAIKAGAHIAVLIGKNGDDSEATEALFASCGVIKHHASVSVQLWMKNQQGKLEQIKL